ncbi:hypothetical protein RJG79_10735 [Mycoplasmatota bacterium WC44]
MNQITIKSKEGGKLISSITDWFESNPPKKDNQWRWDYSAKEAAYEYIVNSGNTLRQLLFHENMAFDELTAVPEYETKIDNYKGEGRNHDLLVFDEERNVVIGVEVKCNESFDKNLKSKIQKALKAKEDNSDSNQIDRIKHLKEEILKLSIDDESTNDVMYQLLTATAGTLVEANVRGAKEAILVIHTILNDKTIKKKHNENNSALDRFTSLLFKDGSYRLDLFKLSEKIIVDSDLYNENRIPLRIAKITNNSNSKMYRKLLAKFLY